MAAQCESAIVIKFASDDSKADLEAARIVTALALTVEIDLNVLAGSGKRESRTSAQSDTS